MPHEFDPGPVAEPFAALVREYPGADVYPSEAFRVEWGPIFHRGRLDGSARLLVIGQDPAESETIVRRILVGEAGHRTQGLMAKLGITRSYVMLNTFLYSVYGSQGAKHAKDEKLVAYRNRWLDALFAANKFDAVIALGQLADGAWQAWRETPTGKAHTPAYQHVTHPTAPESSTRGKGKAAEEAAIAAMLKDWNEALAQLHPLAHPDHAGPLVPYGAAFTPAERIEIPEFDVPPGTPAWMRSPHAWANRTGKDAAAKRLSITVTVPAGVV